MHSQNLGAFLAEADDIKPLMSRARHLLDLQRLLSISLPASLAQAATLANYRQGTVVIHAANGAIAAKLKLLAPGLRDLLLKRGVEVTGIEIEVQPAKSSATPVAKTAKLSATASRELSKLASQLPDSELKSIIVSFSSRGADKNSGEH